MGHKLRSISAILCLPLLISACANGIEMGPPREEPKKVGIFGEGGLRLGGDGGIQMGPGGLFDSRPGGSQNQADTAVNRYIWRGALDTLSAILPIASVDASSGLIATDWGNVTAGIGNERVRATALINSAALSAQSLQVSVFREVLGAGGIWQPAPVDPRTARDIEDAILTRAREIRIAEGG